MAIIQSTPEQPVQTPLKILLMGAPGSRKTTLVLQFPGVYVEDADKNLVGPETWLRANSHKGLNYAYNPIRYRTDGTAREIEDCYDALCDDLSTMTKKPDDYKAFKTVFVDSLSHVNEFIIRKVLHMQNKSKNPYVMDARDWSPFKSYAYVLLVSKLEQINKTVVCSAHEINVTEPDGANVMKERIVETIPFFQGRVGDIIGAFFTDVWRTELRAAPAGKVECWLQTTKTPKCGHLKNSLNMPGEINITEGYKAIEPYLKNRI